MVYQLQETPYMSYHHKCVPERAPPKQFSGPVERRLFEEPQDPRAVAAGTVNGRAGLYPAVLNFRALRRRPQQYYRPGVLSRCFEGGFQNHRETPLVRKIVVGRQHSNDRIIIYLLDAQETL